MLRCDAQASPITPESLLECDPPAGGSEASSAWPVRPASRTSIGNAAGQSGCTGDLVR